MSWVLLVEQIEIAAGDENSGETGDAETETKPGRARPKVLPRAVSTKQYSELRSICCRFMQRDVRRLL